MLSEKPWTLMGILWLMMSIFGCMFVVSVWQAIVQHFTGKAAFEEGTLLALVFSSLALDGSILVGTGIFLWLNEWKWSEVFGFGHRPVPGAILLGLLVAGMFLPFGMVMQEISVRALTHFHFGTPPQAAIEEFNKTVSLGSRVYFDVFALTLVPAAEEVFFRGVLFGGFKQNGYPRLALWGSALAFAAIHLNAATFVPLFALSLVLAWLYERTGNLLACITAHATFNGLNLVLLSFDERIQNFLERHGGH
jgi:uncharacterized protein